MLKLFDPLHTIESFVCPHGRSRIAENAMVCMSDRFGEASMGLAMFGGRDVRQPEWSLSRVALQLVRDRMKYMTNVSWLRCLREHLRVELSQL